MLNILIYLYLMLLPVSDRIFDLYSTIEMRGKSLNFADIFYSVILVLLIAGTRKSECPKRIIRYLNLLVIGGMLLLLYPRVIDYVVYRESLMVVLFAGIKVFVRYMPLVLIIHRYLNELSPRAVVAALTFSSMILALTSIFNDYLMSKFGIERLSAMEIYTTGTIRATGFISIGDGNSQAIFSTFVLALVLINFVHNKTGGVWVIIAFIASFFSVSLIASRGGFISLIAVLVFTQWRKVALTKRQFWYVLVLVVVIVVFTLRNQSMLETVRYRLFQSGVTQQDLNYKGGGGRLYGALAGIGYIFDNPNTFLVGDIARGFSIGVGSTVHNGIIKSVHYAGLLALLWVFGILINYFKVAKLHNVAIIIPFVISLFTLPDFILLLYLVYYYLLMYSKQQKITPGISL